VALILEDTMRWLDTPEGKAALKRAHAKAGKMIDEFTTEMAKKYGEIAKEREKVRQTDEQGFQER
jgi:vacuolar-type H+-ATPase subunit H